MCKSTIIILMRETNFKDSDTKAKRVRRNSLLHIVGDEVVIIFLDNPNMEIPKRRKNSVVGILYVDPPTMEEEKLFSEKFPNAMRVPYEEKEKLKTA